MSEFMLTFPMLLYHLIRRGGIIETYILFLLFAGDKTHLLSLLVLG